jgi:hypothetical protein
MMSECEIPRSRDAAAIIAECNPRCHLDALILQRYRAARDQGTTAVLRPVLAVPDSLSLVPATRHAAPELFRRG